MGGVVESKVTIDILGGNPDGFTIAAIGTDGNYWFRERSLNGSWSAWQVSCAVSDVGSLCP